MQAKPGAAEGLQEYRSHKHVWAARIDGIDRLHGTVTALILRKADGKQERVVILDSLLTSRHDPRIGDYYVVYPDGYCSLSPQKAFVEGYTAIGP
jgi:hypothetical protein